MNKINIHELPIEEQGDALKEQEGIKDDRHLLKYVFDDVIKQDYILNRLEDKKK